MLDHDTLPEGVLKEHLLPAEGEFVYILCDAADNGNMIPIYVGQSRNIYGRLHVHTSNGWHSMRSRAKRRGADIKYIHLLQCGDSRVKIALEKRLIAEFSPRFNSNYAAGPPKGMIPKPE